MEITWLDWCLARIISDAALEAPVHTHCHTLGLSGCARVSCGCVSRKIIAQYHQDTVHPSISFRLSKSRKSYLSLGDSLLAFCCFFYPPHMQQFPAPPGSAGVKCNPSRRVQYLPWDLRPGGRAWNTTWVLSFFWCQEGGRLYTAISSGCLSSSLSLSKSEPRQPSK